MKSIQAENAKAARALRKAIDEHPAGHRVRVTLVGGAVYDSVWCPTKSGQRFYGVKPGFPHGAYLFHVSAVKRVETVPWPPLPKSEGR